MTNKRFKRFVQHEGFVYVLKQLGLSNPEAFDIMELDDYYGNEEAYSMLLDAVRDGNAPVPKGWFESLRDGLSQAIDAGYQTAQRFDDEGHPSFKARLPQEDDWFNRIALTIAMLSIRTDRPAVLLEPKPTAPEENPA